MIPKWDLCYSFIKFVGTHKQYDDIDVEVYDGYSTN